MRFTELTERLGSLPTRAGIAELNWKETICFPRRRGSVIDLPCSAQEFIPLLGGEQFLIKPYNRDPWMSSRLYFGGTDEAPFLVRLDIPWKRCVDEELFFDTLKPPGVKALEKIYNTTAVRQGDWFAFPLPLSWGALCDTLRFIARTWSLVPSIRERKSLQIQSTRHKLINARYISDQYHLRCFGECSLIGEGILTAPDHTDRVLEGPHAFFQTAGLFSPNSAD